MSLYRDNLQFFEDYLHPIYEILTEEKSQYCSDFEDIEERDNILVNNKEAKCFLHSLYNKQREVEQMFSAVDRNIEKLIIFGMGFWNSVDYIKNNFQNLKRIIIVEPDLNIFKEVLNSIDIKEILISLKNVTFIINKSPQEACDIMWESMTSRIMEKTDLAYNVSYRSLYEGYYETINEYLKEYIQNTLINTATQDKFTYLWTKNTLRNLRHKNIPIELFFNNINEAPVIIVSAGPSLNQHLKYLNTLKDKCLIIAVGSAIKILDNHGITPHFRCAFDGSEAEKKIFDGIDTEICPLIYGSMLYDEILDEYKGVKIRSILNTDYINKYIHKKNNDEIVTIASGFSIANVALDAVIKMGFNKVIFMGQDLSYTNGQLYARGSAVENKEIDFTEQGYIKVKDIYNNDVFTTKQFLGMKGLIEDRIKNISNIKFINATCGGLHIEGTVDVELEELMNNELIQHYKLHEKIESIINKYVYEADEEKVKNIQCEILNELKELIKINSDRLKRLKKIYRYIEKEIKTEKISVELDYIDKFEETLNDNNFYSEAIFPMLNTKFTSIISINYYDGDDKKKQNLHRHKILLGKSLELENYLSFINELIEENLKINYINT